MLIRFLCPVCSSRLGASSDLMTHRVDCPHCQAAIVIPDPTSASTMSTAESLIAEEAQVDFHAQREPIDAEMDMTPMVDVTFLLLIFFMVTAAISLQKSFQIPTPREDRPSTNVVSLQDFQEDPEFVVVRIDENSTFHVSAAEWDQEREAPSEQDLLIALGDARNSGQQSPTQLLVIAHGNAIHERVVMAMDAGSSLGMKDVKLVTVEEDPT